MAKDYNSDKRDIVFTNKVRAGKRRTYFFDVRQTKGDDYFITITESTKKHNSDRYERHKIFLYKEDFNRFVSCLQEAVDHIKTDLIPDFDYDEFTRREEEYVASLQEENNAPSNKVDTEAGEDFEDDISW